ncbi:FAD/NAD(P)-binding domain-containing protein [Rhodotorula diobovata]|uniref:FAD/NAD(P)-binding domain-containing protein n=1 Tax=Rhodotorula diobovata TaxID=5288 RepID=A0A5C5FMH9_9BASI|nr:FAD/NAD(P)-binding domain-containing protein [Rhodotorula diobovata]
MLFSTAPQRRIRVVIVGGGISGIAQAVRLQEQLGTKVDLTIYERSHDVGGVWRDSTWPGTAVDIPIHLYCLYSHLSPNFSSKWAGRDEVLGYWRRIVERHQLLDQFVFRSEFVSSRWDSVAQQHAIFFRNVETDETFEVVADVLIAATGALNKEIIPDVPGRDKFKGVQWHSSRWRNDVDLRGKRLAVCGSGSSGIQVIPNIVDIEGIEIVQFIRSPGYYRPKHNFDYSRLQRLLFKVPGVLRLYRWKLFIEHDRNILSRGSGTWASAMRERMAKDIIDYMKSQTPEKYWDALIPKYRWAASLHRPNVDLTSSPIVAVDETGLITADGKHYAVDCIAWATGFEVSETGVGLNKDVYGEDGKELRQTWKEAGGAYGYLGVAVPRVPNYFAVLGPNAIAMSWGYSLGANTEFIARLVRGIYDHDLSSIVVTDEAMASFNAEVTRRLGQTSLASAECGSSWYKDPQTGKLVAPAPWNGTELWTRNRKIAWSDFRCRRFPSPSPSPSHSPSPSPSAPPPVVPLATPQPWTPWGLAADAFARWLRRRLERLMVEVEPGWEEGGGGEGEKAPLVDVEA